MNNGLKAGASQYDITPKDSQFLFGYPHVKRYSTGIHDKLLSSALFLDDGNQQVMFIANDIIGVSKESTKSIRQQISSQVSIKPENIMISSTHTHSGPMTGNCLCNEADLIVPKADIKYIKFMEEQIVKAAVQAYRAAESAKIGLAIADDTGVGTNRRNPKGPSDHRVPVLMVKNVSGDKNIACMLVCSMHPTVLHEDSTLVSGDFPGLSRLYLQKQVLGENCPVLHHTGPSGNQSPRHVTKANTFDEAQRLGEILGKAVEKVIPAIEYQTALQVGVRQVLLTDLSKRQFPSVQESQAKLDKSISKLKMLRDTKAPSQEIRTAECDWFGAEETLTLSKAAADGKLETAYQLALPAEIQVIKVGKWNFVGWPCEIFIEHGLELKKQSADTFIISLANGDLQGYIVTKEAADEGGYEASNAMFDYRTGEILVKETLKILK